MAISNTTFSDIGSAVTDIFGGFGASRASSGYQKAADVAGQNADLAAINEQLKSAALTRDIYKTTAGQQADVGGAGFTAGGSAGDLLRDSTRQGALALQATQVQGSIDINAYRTQQAAYEDQAAAEKNASTADFIGSALKIGAAIASVFI